MEFVLNTTQSTPESSGRTTPILFGLADVDDDQTLSDDGRAKEFQHESSDSDADLELLDDEREQFFKFLNCTKLKLSVEQQRAIGIEIGVNVTEEHPWKQVKRKVLLEELSDDAPEIEQYREKLIALHENALVLVGFVNFLSGENSDTFVFYETDDAAREASNTIKRLEASDRRYLRKSIFKYSRPWQSLGSEKEVNLQLEIKQKKNIEIQIQRLNSGPRVHKPFQLRLTNDIRDGYVELVPKKEDFQFIKYRRINLPIQSAPPMIDREQQTDPTFPSNAWTQYLYEIAVADDIDEEDGDDTCTHEPVIISDSIQQLLKTLEFNAIDVYRNDYAFIAEKSMLKYSNPYLEEVFCFTEPSKCRDKYACSIDWHPVYSGVFVVAYTYNTLNTVIDNDDDQSQTNEKLVLSANRMLLWSFNDTLHPKLELESIREMTCISFCPYDENIVIGGSITGQIIIWDLTDRLKQVEMENSLTEAQERNRELIMSFMSWTHLEDDKGLVLPAAITSPEQSHKARVTEIKWLSRRYYVANTGQLLESLKPNELYRHFVTSSLDGSISFWDLDYQDPSGAKATVSYKKVTNLPDYMKEYTSPYERLNYKLRPNYTIAYDRPISNFLFKSGIFEYTPTQCDRIRKLTTRVAHTVSEQFQENLVNRFVVASLVGTVSTFNCEGFLCKEGKPEVVKQDEKFASVHDGPVLTIESNPFVPDIFLTIGRTIVALWPDDSTSSPIFWRQRPMPISCCKWSTKRAAIFFLACYDGSIEVWDILTRIDEPCVTHVLGGSVLTVVSQHKLSISHEVIAVGDQNGNIRILKLPERMSKAVEGEVERVKEYISREIERKQQFLEGQQRYSELYADVIKAKKLAKEEAAKVEQKLERENTRPKLETENHPKPTFESKREAATDMHDHLRQKWDAMNIKRLMGILLAMKRFDPDLLKTRTKPERDRLAYEEEKRKAVIENIRRSNEELVELRTRLMPEWDADEREQRLEIIQSNVDILFKTNDEQFSYANVEAAANETLLQLASEEHELTTDEIFERARCRREQLNRSLISNPNFKRSYTKE